MKNSQAVNMRFVGITSKITLVTLIAALAISIPMAKYMYEQFHSYNETTVWNEKISALKTIAGYVNDTSFVDKTDSGIKCNAEIEPYLPERVAGDEFSDYLIYAKDENGFYCVLSKEFVSGVDAEYTASLDAVEYFKKAAQSGEIYSFTDKRSIGSISYIAYPVKIFDYNQTSYIGVVVSQVDLYSLRTSELSVFPKVVMIAIGTEFLFVIMMNIILRFVLRRLRSARDILSGNEAPKTTVGNDEITETIQAMSAMKNGIELYMNDIRDCNLSYSKLLPMDLICLVSDKKLTDITFSDMGEKRMLYVRFDFENEDIIKEISELIRTNKGIILKLSARQICCGFRDSLSANTLAEEIFTNGISDFTRVFITKGNICAQVMGDENCRKAVYVCDGEDEYDRISDFTSDGKIIISDSIKEQFAKSDCFKARHIATEKRLSFFDLLYIDRVKENKTLFKKKTFETAVKCFYNGNKKIAKRKFTKLSKENPTDKATALYLEKTSEGGAK